ncbi:TM2 domain-containing protein [Leeuwenhoekiella polynyae]|uniref:TM2 domain-containing membrane protein YozV n=1 Tax=Leeuwenhoekiella polynyae TaxID=1550906 RepID=A0A4Q0P124_9FLAO|nr:TM2 domain-containing protein [Leeuwenhoekiella polynyae]RXG20087.1 TM2 domain-containing membrane protein YozV [Leeuwenhoekiella polynyae]|tara:strand:- start:411 stop:758 length:348 start_codon:yes stop_codon:yes gene_type:complete
MEENKNFNDRARDTASNFGEEAKNTANEFKENWNETTNSGNNLKLACGLLGIFLGYLGIHKFVLGYTKEGIIQLVASIITCGFAGIIGFIEGIIYLTKSDDEFYRTYQQGRRPWF